MSSPATVAVPSVGSSSPHSMRIVVVLPEPLGPSRPKTSPRGICSVRRETAVTAPKRRVSSLDVDRGVAHGVSGTSSVTGRPALSRPAGSSNSTLIANTRSARSRSVSAARGVNSARDAISTMCPATGVVRPSA